MEHVEVRKVSSDQQAQVIPSHPGTLCEYAQHLGGMRRAVGRGASLGVKPLCPVRVTHHSKVATCQLSSFFFFLSSWRQVVAGRKWAMELKAHGL